ncbi:MAG: GMC family oxidoreductase, partial [Alphaproteobacteria bacterium]|nr:GMC family oxidoreductase [Alphaproteobacteria bacterium]
MRADDQVPAVTYAHDDPVVVIIGSGAGGGTLAHELCAQGVGVVLIEAGPRFAPQDFINDEWAAYEQLTWRDRRTSSGSSPAVRLFPDTPTWVCKAVGGSTVHWGAVSMRLQAHELRARTVYGAVPGTSLIDWPLDLAELAPYYDRAERNMGVAGTQGLPPLPANNNFKLLAAGARRVGYRAVSLGTLAINARP